MNAKPKGVLGLVLIFAAALWIPVFMGVAFVISTLFPSIAGSLEGLALMSIFIMAGLILLGSIISIPAWIEAARIKDKSIQILAEPTPRLILSSVVIDMAIIASFYAIFGGFTLLPNVLGW